MSKRKNIYKTDSVFSLPLPLVKTFEEVQSIQKLYPYPDYDPYFIESGVIKEKREKFNKLWPKYKPYADSNFQTEIQKRFHQKTWEMYMGNILLENNMKIFSEDKGPDFIVKNDNDEDLLYIECVCTTKGKPENPNSVIDPIELNNSSGYLHDVPTDKMILRIAKAFDDKVKQYNSWIKGRLVNKDTPFIIAINTSVSSWIEGFPPNVIKAIFGISHPQINMRTGEMTFLIRDEIQKNNGSPVPVNMFKIKDFSFISGVIFSNTDILDNSNKLGVDCYIVNNPFAKHTIPELLTKCFKTYESYISKDGYVKIKKRF